MNAPLEMELRQLEAQPTVCVHLVMPMAEADMGALFARYLPIVAACIGDLGTMPVGPSFGRFHEWGGDVADIEIGFPVAAPPAGLRPLSAVKHGEPGASELPGGLAGVALHRGPYKRLPAVYPKLRAWIEARGHAPGEGPWEAYVDDAQAVDHAAMRTEIVWPVS